MRRIDSERHGEASCQQCEVGGQPWNGQVQHGEIHRDEERGQAEHGQSHPFPPPGSGPRARHGHDLILFVVGEGRPSWAAAYLCYEHLRPDATPPPGFLSKAVWRAEAVTTTSKPRSVAAIAESR